MSSRFLLVKALNVAAMCLPNSASSSLFTRSSIPRVMNLPAIERICSWVHLDVYLVNQAEPDLLEEETKGESLR